MLEEIEGLEENDLIDALASIETKTKDQKNDPADKKIILENTNSSEFFDLLQKAIDGKTVEITIKVT